MTLQMAIPCKVGREASFLRGEGLQLFFRGKQLSFCELYQNLELCAVDLD
jgi:hypothetical protein